MSQAVAQAVSKLAFWRKNEQFEFTNAQLVILDSYKKAVERWHIAQSMFANANSENIDLAIAEVNVAELAMKAARKQVAELGIPADVLIQYQHENGSEEF